MALHHPSYARISQAVRRKRDWRDDEPLTFPEEQADLYFLSFVSENGDCLLGHDQYRCDEHGLAFPAEPVVEEPADCAIAENRRFRYPLLRDRGPTPARRLLIVLHGLNERSFGKYVPWAYQLWHTTGAAVALFPLTFHINRVLPAWGQQVSAHRARRQRVPGNENVHAFNAVISERLDAHPERFFWGGLQSYRDVRDLVHAIRLGRHPHVDPDAQIDFLGYSAGGYVALAQLLEDPGRRLATSRAVVFESCVSLRETNLSSRFILDLAAEIALSKLYVRHREKFANARLNHWLDEHPEGRWFRAFCGAEADRPRLEARLAELAGRLLGVANVNDRVMPHGAMLNALQGVHRDTGVRVVELDLGIHENPFSCPDYNQRERKYVADFLDPALFGQSFETFIDRTLTLLG